MKMRAWIQHDGFNGRMFFGVIVGMGGGGKRQKKYLYLDVHFGKSNLHVTLL